MEHEMTSVVHHNDINPLTKSLLGDRIFVDAKRHHHRTKFLVEELQRNKDTFDTDLYYACKKYRDLGHTLAEQETSVRYQEKIMFKLLHGSLGQRIVVVITTLIVIISCSSVALETMAAFNPYVYTNNAKYFHNIEVFATIYFSLELSARFYFSGDKTGFFLEFLNVADVTSIMPFYLELLMNNTGTFRFLRFLRLLRTFRFMASFKVFQILASASLQSAKALFGPIIFLLYSMVFMSAFLFYAERGEYNPKDNTFHIRDCDCEMGNANLVVMKAQGMNVTGLCPSIPTLFHSIPHTMWWAVVTMTSVGYGDMVPKCPTGKFLASVSMVMGSFFMAMPIAIVGSFFTHAAEKNVNDLAEKKANSAQKLADDLQEVKYVFSAGESLIQYLAGRMGPVKIDIENPSDKLKSLLDEYFKSACPKCCVGCKSRMLPDFQPYRYVLKLKECPVGSVCPAEVVLPVDSVELTLGSTCSVLPDPDLALDAVCRGIAQRHAQFIQLFEAGRVYPRLYVSSLLTESQTLEVNGNPVGIGGVELHIGDLIDFTPHMLRPTSYRVVMTLPTPDV